MVKHLDASELGWLPGYWPSSFDDGDEVFYKIDTIRHYTGNDNAEEGFVYQNADQTTVYFVFND